MSPTTRPDCSTAFANLLLAVQDFDLDRIVDVLDAEAERHGLDVVVDEVVFPALRIVGTFWEHGSFSVAHEHLFTAAATRWLHARLGAEPPPSVRRGGRAVVLAAGPEDLHVIGLDCLELLLTARGVTACNLGALVPTDALVATASHLHAAAVVVCSHAGAGASSAGSATTSLRAVHAAGIGVLYAGSNFDSAFVQRRLPGTALNHSVAESADLLARLAATPPTSSTAPVAVRAAAQPG